MTDHLSSFKLAIHLDFHTHSFLIAEDNGEENCVHNNKEGKTVAFSIVESSLFISYLHVKGTERNSYSVDFMESV
jgi:hypothetical protein